MSYLTVSDDSSLNEPLLHFHESNIDLPSTDHGTCPVCIQETLLETILDCGHRFCHSCIQTYLEYKIMEGQVSSIRCLNFTCETILPAEYIASMLTPEYTAKYERFLNDLRLEQNPYHRWCPRPDCSGYAFRRNSDKLKCRQCGLVYCFHCSEPWHKRRQCKNRTDMQFEQWAGDHRVKFCPMCKRRVEKDGGCKHMTCARCGYNWCWVCGKATSDPTHNELTCTFGESSLDLFWIYILALLFAPLLFPFAIPLYFLYIDQVEGVDDYSIFVVLKKFKWISYPLLFLVSPLIMAVAMVVVGFVVAAVFLQEACNWMNCSIYCVLMFFFILTIGSILSAIAILLVVLVLVLAPLAGLFFFICKLVRKRNDPSYPRTFV